MIQHQDLYRNTLCYSSQHLCQLTEKEIWIKMESQQPSGSFKNRGIGLFCLEKAKEGFRQFVSSSGGNAGCAAAYACKNIGAKITVVVPKSTPKKRINLIRQEEAEVIIHGNDWQEADQLARKMVTESKACYISPFDDPLIWKGHATMIKEIKDAGYKPDAVVVAVGGGGLLSGVIEGMQDAGWTDISVYAVETEGADSYAAALRAGIPVEIPAITSAAKSLGARKVAEQAVKWATVHPIVSKVVKDEDAISACKKFENHEGEKVELAAGASLSLIYGMDPDVMKHQRILVVVCGESSE